MKFISIKEKLQKWNEYILNNNYTNNTNITYNINNTNNTFFNKIEQTNLNGRHLELFLSLFIIADMCSKDILEEEHRWINTTFDCEFEVI